MIELLLGLIIGLLVGASFVYWALRQKLKEQKRELKQTKRTITNLTRAHELQVQETVASLQRNYRQKLEAEAASLAQHYVAQPQANTASPEPAPEPEPKPEPVLAPSIEPAEALPVPNISAPAAPPPAIAPIADPWGEPVAEPQLDLAPVSAAAAAPVPPLEPVAASATPMHANPRSNHQTVAPWGKSGEPLSQLLAHHTAPDATLRQQVAITLGQRYGGQPIRPGDQPVLATLAALGRDSNPGVRRAAVEALSTVKSAAVIPVLQRALRDTDAGVVKAASLAIAQFKRYPMPVSKPALPKPIKR